MLRETQVFFFYALSYAPSPQGIFWQVHKIINIISDIWQAYHLEQATITPLLSQELGVTAAGSNFGQAYLTTLISFRLKLACTAN